MDIFNRKVKEKIKLYSKEQYLDGYIKKEFLTDDGTAELFLNINDRDDIFDPYTVGEQQDLRKEIYDFIEEKSSLLGNQIPIRLNIKGYKFDNHEKEAIKHILKEHFAIELYNKQQEYIKYRNKIVFLIMLGIISFLLYIIFSLIIDFEFLLIIFSFISSFAIWEAMDSIIYTISDIKYDREAITQNLLLTVEFTDK